MGNLAEDTRVEGGDGTYTANVSRDWEIWGPNGGYISSLALRAAGAHSRFARPASIVGHFLGVAGFEPLEIAVTTTRAAKRAEAMRVSLTQHDAPIFEAMVWSVGDVSGLEHDATDRPAYPDPESVPPTSERLADRAMENPYHKFWANFDERVADDHWVDDWDNREPSMPEMHQWYRFLPASTFDDPWVDACRSLILVDTLGWPAVCRLHIKPDYIAPSIDIACAFHHARPAEPWMLVQARAISATGGLVGCENRVWSRDGALLAHGTSQLLCRPMPQP